MFLKKLKIELPYDPAITLLGTYPGKPKRARVPQYSFQNCLQWPRHGNNVKCPMTDEWTRKMWCSCIHYGILLSHKRERNWVVCKNVDEPQVCHTERSQKEKNKYHILTHICRIQKKWYRWTYLQGRNRDTNVENRFVGTAGKGEGVMNWENSFDTYTRSCVKQIASG